jgi:predicted DCC family thiol-disulfide oxidoreductase YuxK
MHIHPQIHTATDEYFRFLVLQHNEERMSAQSSGGIAARLNNKPILIYDGICNLCTTAVRFLHALDRSSRLEYVASQLLSLTIRQKYKLTSQQLQGQMHLIRGNSIIGGSGALAEILGLLTPFGFVSVLLRTRPAEQLYSWIASHRYRVFGCRGSCYIVHSENVSEQ